MAIAFQALFESKIVSINREFDDNFTSPMISYPYEVIYVGFDLCIGFAFDGIEMFLKRDFRVCIYDFKLEISLLNHCVFVPIVCMFQ